MFPSDEWSLDELPDALPWLATSLTNDLPRRRRSVADLVQEFERDKWGSLWREFDGVDNPTLESVEGIFYNDAKRPITIRDRRILGAPPLATQALALRTSQIMTEFAPDSRTLVEIGVGYGAFALRVARNLQSDPVEIVGVDLSPSALDLLAMVCSAEGIPARAEVWDLNSPAGLGEVIPRNSVVVTCNTLMYLSNSATPLLREIANSHPSLVVHAEPLIADQRRDLLGLLATRYIRQNGYNERLWEDIASFLRHEDGPHALRAHEPRVAGMNPLLPTSIVAWGPSSGVKAQSADQPHG